MMSSIAYPKIKPRENSRLTLARPLLVAGTAAMSQLYLWLLCRHSSDKIVATDHLTVVIVGYSPRLQSPITVVGVCYCYQKDNYPSRCYGKSTK